MGQSHLCWILVLGCLWAPRWGFSGPGRGVLLAQAAGISEDKNCGSFGDESFRDSAADAVAIKQQPAQWWKLQGCSDTGYRCPLPGPDCESCRGLWWLRGLPRPTADGLLRCCGLHRAHSIGAMASACPYVPSFLLGVSSCLCCAHHPRGQAGMRQLLRQNSERLGKEEAHSASLSCLSGPWNPPVKGTLWVPSYAILAGRMMQVRGKLSSYLFFVVLFFIFPLLYCCSFMTGV